MSTGDDILDEAIGILNRMPGLGKTRVPGQTLTTDLTGPVVIADETLAKIRGGDAPDRDDLRAVIFALDLLTAGAPDNDRLPFDADIQRVAGKLRERYSRRYKTSAYTS